MPATPTPRKSKAYSRMAHQAHQAGNHDLGNHWARKARDLEARAARCNGRNAKVAA